MQNAIISASGGDFTTLTAWRNAVEFENHGAATRAYIDGAVAAGGTVAINGSGGRFPHGAEIFALPGQEYNGTNHTTCARLSHTASLLEAANVDIWINGLAIVLTGGFNAEPFKISNTVATTQRRTIKLDNFYIESAPSYHGSAYALELDTATFSSGNGSQYHIEIENGVIFARASVKAFLVGGRDAQQSFTGYIRQLTILPTNSGSTATNGLWVGAGNDSSLSVDKILALGSEVRQNVVDYRNDGMGGTFTNITTHDATGTITGRTAATELENYAAGDYRLKSTSAGNGAFPQGGVIPSNVNSDVSISWPMFLADVSQQSFAPEYQSSVSYQWPLFSVSLQQSYDAPINQNSVSVDWPLFSVVANQQSENQDYNSTVSASWPIFAVSAAMSNSAPDVSLEADISWPMFSVSAYSESILPAGSTTVSVSWPQFSVESSQESSVPIYISTVLSSWPMFSASSEIDYSDAEIRSDASFSWPLFSVLSSQEYATPAYNSNASISWPMFSVSAISGEFTYVAGPDSVFKIPFLSADIKVPFLSSDLVIR